MKRGSLMTLLVSVVLIAAMLVLFGGRKGCGACNLGCAACTACTVVGCASSCIDD